MVSPLQRKKKKKLPVTIHARGAGDASDGKCVSEERRLLHSTSGDGRIRSAPLVYAAARAGGWRWQRHRAALVSVSSCQKERVKKRLPARNTVQVFALQGNKCDTLLHNLGFIYLFISPCGLG